MISVIIPVYNVEKYLEKCVESIINQTYKDIEIILVEDCSTDNSYDICKRLKQKYPQIVLLRNEKNSGSSASRNKGMAIARGEYLIFTDSDDSVSPNYLKTLHKNIVSYDSDISICSVRMVYNDTYPFDAAEKHSPIRTMNRHQLLENIQLKDGFQGFPVNKLFKKSIIQNNGIKFDERVAISEDLLFCCQYISKINSGVFEDIPLYLYLQRPCSVLNGSFNPRSKHTLTAYDTIFNIYKDNDMKNHPLLIKNFTVTNMDLKEKLITSDTTDDDFLKQLNKNISDNLSSVMKGDAASRSEKIKLFIRAKFTGAYILIKTTVRKLKFAIKRKQR